MKTVLVTGAAGTVGGHVVPLLEAAGFRVVATDLDASAIRVPVRGEIRAADLRDPEAVERVVRHVDAVVHTAALLDATADEQTLHEVNARAVARLFEAAEAAGARRFVHMSTAMIYAPHARGPVRVGCAVAPRGPHGASKLAAEEWLRARRGRLAWTILRAAPIYGRRGRHFAAGLLVIGPLLRLVTPLLPRPSGGPVATMVHAEDVARALVHVLERSATEGEILDVSDGDAIPLGDRIAATFDAYGLRSIRTGPLSGRVLGAVGRALRAPGAFESTDAALLGAWRLVVARHGLRPALRPRLDREALTLFTDDLVVDASRLRAIGWRPLHADFRRGFADVLRWYQAERWVPRY
ncbi:MAG: NAD(P)-dependent oxidoreductase [Myxococcota bacterium]|nr:NAD(P)-dependent oxidoreductase [Myxococcota bacterium]MDW8362121.1 NAD(P)-dependent oxidoreductase [Myxococcales bacterium]